MASKSKEGTKRLTVADGFCDLRKHLKRADCSVDLMSGMVGHDDTFAPDFERFTRVGDVLNPLEDEWSTTGDAFPLVVRFASEMRTKATE